jgi:sigma-B regulation protein RsbU (phosphoserine phosphatase)
MGVKRNQKDIAVLTAVFLFSVILYGTLYKYDAHIYRIFHMEAFLAWHVSLEVLSTIMSFCIFFISYYTFERSRHQRTIIFACTFLSVGLLDTFHALSYEGMPTLLTEASASVATSLWIAARLTAALGMMAAAMTDRNKLVHVHRNVYIAVAFIYSVILIYVISWHQNIIPPLFIEGQGLTSLKISLEYLIIAIQLIAMLFFYLDNKKEKESEEGYNYLILALMLSTFSEVAFTQYTNVYDSYNVLGHVYKIVAYYFIFKAKFVINVQKPYFALYETERQLVRYADNLEKLVEKRTEEITAANEKLMKDLDYVGVIQSALLPVSFPKIPQLEFSARYLPCEKIGGDFYNVYKLDDENVGFLIGDVAGHGVSAAMITVFINQNIHVRREYDDGRIRVLTPKQVLNNLFYIYNRMSFPEEIYTVLFYGVYNLESRVLTYCSAGMNASPLILRKDGEIEQIPIEGLPICKLGAFVSPSYDNHSIQLEDGDSLLFYTDGLIEIDRKRPDQFNEHNLMEFLRGIKNASAEEVAESMTDLFYAILGDKKMIDDVTILVAKINEM